MLKGVHPDLGISNQGMKICESLINDMFDRIMVEATRLLRISGEWRPSEMCSKEIYVLRYRYFHLHVLRPIYGINIIS